MNENAKKWVEALRSGEYEQGVHNMRSLDDRYCCLGVACSLYASDTGEGTWEETDRDGPYGPRFAFKLDGESSVAGLPRRVRGWLDLTDSTGGFDSGRSLSGLNDNDRTFLEIADTIEAEPEGLFR